MHVFLRATPLVLLAVVLLLRGVPNRAKRCPTPLGRRRYEAPLADPDVRGSGCPCQGGYGRFPAVLAQELLNGSFG